MINKPRRFYGPERKVCYKDYQFRLGMIHSKVFSGLGGRSWAGEGENLSPPPPSTAHTHTFWQKKRKVCDVLRGFSFFFKKVFLLLVGKVSTIMVRKCHVIDTVLDSTGVWHSQCVLDEAESGGSAVWGGDFE